MCLNWPINSKLVDIFNFDERILLNCFKHWQTASADWFTSCKLCHYCLFFVTNGPLFMGVVLLPPFLLKEILPKLCFLGNKFRIPWGGGGTPSNLSSQNMGRQQPEIGSEGSTPMVRGRWPTKPVVFNRNQHTSTSYSYNWLVRLLVVSFFTKSDVPFLSFCSMGHTRSQGQKWATGSWGLRAS